MLATWADDLSSSLYSGDLSLVWRLVCSLIDVQLSLAADWEPNEERIVLVLRREGVDEVMLNGSSGYNGVLFRPVNGDVCEGGVQSYDPEGDLELDDGVMVLDRRRCVQQCGSAQAFGGFLRTVICQLEIRVYNSQQRNRWATAIRGRLGGLTEPEIGVSRLLEHEGKRDSFTMPCRQAWQPKSIDDR